VDGVTITGNGTTADPLVAIGGGGGTPLTTQDEGVNVSTNTTTLNFTGDGVTASLTSPGVVEVNIPSGGGGGGVTAVTGTAPIASSGGATPDISISQASSSSDGYLSSSDWSTFDGKQDALTAGTGIDITSNVVSNTAPDQTVVLTAGTGISTSGTYPNFTIDNTAPDQVVSLTAGTDISITGTYPSFTIASTAATGMQGGQATGTDTYAVSIPGVTGYSLNDAYAIGFTNANTGASTLNINGLGAVNIAKNNTVPIIGGDIAPNQQFIAIYDGTNFQLLGVAPNQMFAYVTNADSVTINRGQPVYAFGATGDRMTVKLANNTTEATSSKTVGLVFSSSIGPNQKGYIITQGVVDGINTGMFTAGDTLYVGNTAGSLTNTLPLAPNHLTRIGIVERANAGNGQIYVFVQNGFQLDELSDVDITTVTPVNNDFLVYTTGVNNLWKNRSLGNVLGGTTSQYVRGDGSLATLPSASSTPYIEGELIGNAISQNSNCLDIFVEPSINRLYVPFFGGNVTYIFNTSTNALVATLSTTGVNAVFYIASVNQLWVTYLANGNISRFNATTGASAGADITGSGNRGQHYIEYSATKVFIANSGSNNITVINPSTGTVTATIAAGSTFPRSMVLNSNPSSAQNDRIAVVCPNANTMLLINPNTNAITIAAVNVGSQMSTPNSIVYDATSDRYIIGNVGNNRLLYITPTTATSFTYDTYTDAYRPYELAYNSSTRYVYIAQPTPANSVFNPTSLALVDAATKQMFKQIVTTSFDLLGILWG
jgi:YVTN family beta-propeller protein